MPQDDQQPRVTDGGCSSDLDLVDRASITSADFASILEHMTTMQQQDRGSGGRGKARQYGKSAGQQCWTSFGHTCELVKNRHERGGGQIVSRTLCSVSVRAIHPCSLSQNMIRLPTQGFAVTAHRPSLVIVPLFLLTILLVGSELGVYYAARAYSSSK